MVILVIYNILVYKDSLYFLKKINYYFLQNSLYEMQKGIKKLKIKLKNLLFYKDEIHI